MNSPAIATPPQFSDAKEYPARSVGNDFVEVADAPRSSSHAARGAITGILLGVSLWAIILVLFGVIKI